MTTENSRYSTIQAAVDAIRRGEVVIVVDAEDRENEGDFICAAELVTAETINFMLRGAARPTVRSHSAHNLSASRTASTGRQ